MSKGNYATSWGNTYWGQYNPSPSGITNPINGRPLVYMDSAFGHKTVKFATVRDGLSTTVFVAEVLQGDTNDVRGVVWSSVPGGGSFMTRFTPNKFQDYLRLTSGGDYLNQTIFCVSEPVAQLPCTGNAGDHAAFAGARSRHPGGINALFGDGSVKFLKDSINPVMWLGVNTIKGGEIISADQY